MSHTFNINKEESSYHFAPTYLGPFRKRGQEGFPVIMGDIDHEGSVIVQAIHEPADNTKLKFQAQVRGLDVGRAMGTTACHHPYACMNARTHTHTLAKRPPPTPIPPPMTLHCNRLS